MTSRAAHAAQVYKGLLDGVQMVAVKQLTDQSPRQQERFAQEIALLRSCRAENIVSFLGAAAHCASSHACFMHRVYHSLHDERVPFLMRLPFA